MGSLTVVGGTEKPGDVKFHAANAIPPGWLKANGAAVSRAAYGALFAEIGTTYGAGDGATTFALPDMRGEFVRGFDDGRGVDSGRVMGAAQAHGVSIDGTFEALTVTQAATGVFAGVNLAGNVLADGTTRNTSRYTLSGGSTETRPRNVAMLACIKF